MGRVTTIQTLKGSVQVYSSCRVEVYSVEREYAEVEPVYLLPADFSPGQWKELTLDEQFISAWIDRRRLSLQVERLEKKTSEYLVLLLMSGVIVLVLLAALGIALVR